MASGVLLSRLHANVNTLSHFFAEKRIVKEGDEAGVVFCTTLEAIFQHGLKSSKSSVFLTPTKGFWGFVCACLGENSSTCRNVLAMTENKTSIGRYASVFR